MMMINRQPKTNFQSRNKTIRYADDIARRVNVCYPRISSSIVDDFENVCAFRNYQKKIGKRIRETLRGEISDNFDDADNFIGKILAFIKPIKKHKVGNCGESAQLASIVAKVNGIKDCYIASLRTSRGRGLDHSVLYVNDKKPYIIDAWLGFADYEPNAIRRFKTEYGKHFFILKDDKLVFEPVKSDYSEVLNQDYTRRQINKLRKLYPEQVIKKGFI